MCFHVLTINDSPILHLCIHTTIIGKTGFPEVFLEFGVSHFPCVLDVRHIVFNSFLSEFTLFVVADLWMFRYDIKLIL